MTLIFSHFYVICYLSKALFLGIMSVLCYKNVNFRNPYESVCKEWHARSICQKCSINSHFWAFRKLNEYAENFLNGPVGIRTRGLMLAKHALCQLSYGPIISQGDSGLKCFRSVFWQNNHLIIFLSLILYNKFIGGDPSAGSPTDTLCRLNLPCHVKVRILRASSRHNSVGLTGSVCKGRGLIHRSLMKNDYYGFQRHVVRLQTTIWTELHFMGLASPFGVASLWMQHCRARVAQGIRAVLT